MKFLSKIKYVSRWCLCSSTIQKRRKTKHSWNPDDIWYALRAAFVKTGNILANEGASFHHVSLPGFISIALRSCALLSLLSLEGVLTKTQKWVAFGDGDFVKCSPSPKFTRVSKHRVRVHDSDCVHRREGIFRDYFPCGSRASTCFRMRYFVS